MLQNNFTTLQIRILIKAFKRYLAKTSFLLDFNLYYIFFAFKMKMAILCAYREMNSGEINSCKRVSAGENSLFFISVTDTAKKG